MSLEGPIESAPRQLGKTRCLLVAMVRRYAEASENPAHARVKGDGQYHLDHLLLAEGGHQLAALGSREHPRTGQALSCGEHEPFVRREVAGVPPDVQGVELGRGDPRVD